MNKMQIVLNGFGKENPSNPQMLTTIPTFHACLVKVHSVLSGRRGSDDLPSVRNAAWVVYPVLLLQIWFSTSDCHAMIDVGVNLCLVCTSP